MVCIDKCHLCFFVIIFVVHIVDDIHRFVVYTSHFFQDLLVVSQYLFKVQYIAAQYRDVFYHQCTGIFATSTVDSQQQRFSQVTTCTEELDVATYILVRYTTSDTVVIRVTHFTHQLVVFVLDRRGVDRYLCTEVLETFRQFRAPQNCQVWFWRRTEVVQCLQETE